MPQKSFGISPSPGNLSTSQSFPEFDASLSNVNGSLNCFNLPQDPDLNTSTISHVSYKSDTSLGFKKFSSRLYSNMSTFSDGLPFSDIDDFEESEQMITDMNNSGNISVAKEVLFDKPNLKSIQEKHASLDKGALFFPPSSKEAHRSATPTPNEYGDITNIVSNNLHEITPTKPIQPEVDPLTPTANLKLLLSAASPEIRNREQQRLNETGEFDMSELAFTSIDEDSIPSVVEIETRCQAVENVGKSARVKKKPKKLLVDEQPLQKMQKIGPAISRKEKSLGLLCQRFLALYPEFPDKHQPTYICLDAVASHLGVERRRIYDIVNVLESVEIVSRSAKNKYAWHGKTNIESTLYKLMVIGREEGLRDQLEKMEEISEAAMLYKPTLFDRPDETLNSSGVHRKDKSLGLLSQKFLSLFLVAEAPKIINLDLSAKILIGDPFVDKTEAGKFKTKIRRLYDIANILSSLDLIRKVHITETRGRKPAFQYVGPDPDSLHLLHSSGNLVMRPNKGSYARNALKRHASFEQICQVAETEHERLHLRSKTDPGASSDGSILRSQLNEPPLCINPDAILQQTSTNEIPEVPKQPHNNHIRRLVIRETKPEVVKSVSSTTISMSAAVSTTVPNNSASEDKATKVVTLSNKDLDVLIQQLDATNAKSVEVSDGNKSRMTLNGPLLKALREARSSSTVSASNLAPGANVKPATIGSNVVKQIRIVKRTVPKPQVGNQAIVKQVGVAIKRENNSSEDVSPKILKTEPTEENTPVSHSPVIFQKPNCSLQRTESNSDGSSLKSKHGSFGLSPMRPLSLGDPYLHMPKIPSMDIGLPSPLPGSYGSSGLHTPTLPLTFSEESNLKIPDIKVENGSLGGVFQFPAPAPLANNDSQAQKTKSAPGTPTLRLSCTSSPVMLLPPRPSSFSSEDELVPLQNGYNKVIAGKSNLTPQAGSVFGTPQSGTILTPYAGVPSPVFITPQSGSTQTKFLTTQRCINAGFLTPKNRNGGLITPQSGKLLLCSPTISPLAPFTTSTPTSSLVLQNGTISTPTDLNDNVLGITPTDDTDKAFSITPLGIRPSSGIAPSSGKIMNLMSLFTTPTSSTVSPDPGSRNCQVDKVNASASPVLDLTSSLATQGLNSESGRNSATQISTDYMQLSNKSVEDGDVDLTELTVKSVPKLKTGMNPEPSAPINVVETLNTPATIKIKPVATPGTFFRSTPQGISIQRQDVCKASAFTTVKSGKVMQSGVLPVRRLSMLSKD